MALNRRLLIVNADDFGLTRGVNSGIIRAHKEGIVTSTTLLAGCNASEEAVELAKENELLSTGIHLNCKQAFSGDCACDRKSVPGYVKIGIPKILLLWVHCTVNAKHREKLLDSFRYQVEWAYKRGLDVSHLDTHKHVHAWPAVASIVCRVANEYGIPAVRYPFEPFWIKGPLNLEARFSLLLLFVVQIITRRILRSYELDFPDNFRGVLCTGYWTKTRFLSVLKTLPDGVTEIMVHPGYSRELRGNFTRLVLSREVELGILTDPELKLWCKKNVVELVNYRYFQS